MSDEQSIRDEEERPVIELARVIASWDQGIDMSHRIPHWAVNLAMHLREQGYSRPVSPQEPTEADAAFAWAEYRHDIEPNRRSLGRESVAFKAGWNAALRRGALAEPAVTDDPAQTPMSSDAEREVQYGRRERATGRIAPLMGHPFADWWSESQQDWEHVQRDVGPWVPVAEWERSRPVSDQEVEAAVAAVNRLDWGAQHGGVDPDCIDIARAALEAAAKVRAQGVAAEQAPDRETIARTLYEAPFDGMDDTVWPPAHPTDREWWLTRADAVTALINGEGT